jgi:Putative auto-transporter adhesin, head GIN domain
MRITIKIMICSLLLTASAKGQSWMGEKIKGNGNLITEKRNTSEYDEIKLQGFFDVDLVSGNEGEIMVLAEENLLPFIKVEIEGNVLRVFQEKGKNLQPSKGKKILIIIPFDKISVLSLSGSGDIKTKKPIKTDGFVATLSGSGDLKLEVEAKILEAKISGSGDFILKGKSDKLIAKISGSGDINADDLEAKDVEVGISGSGDIKVNCSENLKVRVSGSGDVFYKGNPKTKDTKVSGSGEIKQD